MANVLFTCAGRRNYLVEFFKSADPTGTTMGADARLDAPALQDCDKRFKLPSVNDAGYFDELATLCEGESVDLVISLNDLELPRLAARRDEFANFGTELLVSGADVVDICGDKFKTFEWLEAQGFSTPRACIDLHVAEAWLDEGLLEFPLIVKPRWGSASFGINKVETREELRLTVRLLSLQINRGMLKDLGESDKDRVVLIQQCVSSGFVEHGVDVLNDFTGSTQSVYVKEKLAMRSGETDKACLRDLPVVENLGHRVGEALGHIGNMDCDIFFDAATGEAEVLELNPRFGGGYPFSQLAGARYPDALLAWSRQEQYDCSAFKRHYDQVFAKTERMVDIVETESARQLGAA